MMWIKFVLKSVTVFGGALSLTGNTLSVTKTEFGWLIFLSPAIGALLAYWSGVADAMPAPWAVKNHVTNTKVLSQKDFAAPTP